jgi:hypothetical protein
MDKHLEKFGSNFIVAAFVPSLTFVIACTISFGPLFFSPFDSAQYLAIPLSFEEFWKYGLGILLLGIILSFSLSSLNTFLLKVLEGYVFFEHFPLFLNREKRRERRIRQKLNWTTRKLQKIKILNANCKRESIRERYGYHIAKLKLQQYQLATEHQNSFPSNPAEILPTRFGNILKAAEYYSTDRYGIDAVPLWPRLVYVIDKNYLDFIDQSNNQLSFLVNCMFLSISFSCISLPASIFLILTRQSNSWFYILLSILGIFTAYIFHRASLFSVGQYGDMIRSAYDLFRFDLLKILRHPLPTNSTLEKVKWQSISEYMNTGDRSELTFTYDFHDPSEKINKTRKRISRVR